MRGPTILTPDDETPKELIIDDERDAARAKRAMERDLATSSVNKRKLSIDEARHIFNKHTSARSNAKKAKQQRKRNRRK